MVIIKFIILVTIAYFIGNISPSIILGKLSGVDIKKEGSGNAGTTNALRVLGKKAAVITLIIDIGKGVGGVPRNAFGKLHHRNSMRFSCILRAYLAVPVPL